MQKQVNDIQADVKEIKDALLGNDYKGGLISEIGKNSQHRKNSLKTTSSIAAFSVVIGGFLGKFWDKLF
tara:strand:- start:129 stop:335 length:207 start_codon:yes stop_codon:yes gene_type:complete